MVKKRELKMFFHNSNYPSGLGCAPCPELPLCGGEHTPGLFDCMEKCCGDPENCDYICIKDVDKYIADYNSISGFDLSTVPKSASLPSPELPYSVPLINNSYNRIVNFDSDAVAVQLRFLYDHRTGKLKFKERDHLFEHYKLSKTAKLVITGVSKDPPLESYWIWSRVRELAKEISMLKPDLIGSPNFSLFLDSPRYDNLYNMKRIVICWQEFLSLGIPCALHINARTDHDWKRWTEFIYDRDEVTSISVEFATGGKYSEMGDWKAEQLIKLASEIPRKLQLLIRGGYKYLGILHKAFPDTVFLDSASFIKSTKRQAFTWVNPNKKWESVASPYMTQIDHLLKFNSEKMAIQIRNKLHWG